MSKGDKVFQNAGTNSSSARTGSVSKQAKGCGICEEGAWNDPEESRVSGLQRALIKERGIEPDIHVIEIALGTCIISTAGHTAGKEGDEHVE